MIIRLIILIAVIAMAYWYLFTFKKQSAEEQKKSLQRLAIYGGIGVIVLLILTGRISAVYGLVAGLIPWFERAAIFKRLYEKVKNKDESQAHNHSSHHANSHSHQQKNKMRNTEMNLAEAQDILGLDKDINKIKLEDVNHAYKRLIQKNHPDAGGSEHIAQKIIEARKRLIDHLS